MSITQRVQNIQNLIRHLDAAEQVHLGRVMEAWARCWQLGLAQSAGSVARNWSASQWHSWLLSSVNPAKRELMMLHNRGGDSLWTHALAEDLSRLKVITNLGSLDDKIHERLQNLLERLSTPSLHIYMRIQSLFTCPELRLS